MTRQLEREIEAAVEARTGRECVFMPSGRFAMHLAFRLLLSPGDRILMSPLEDDTVFFGALAAGLRPVNAPVSTHDGNIRVEAVSDATWSSIAAVLTGNTYGLPDRVAELSAQCARLGIPLVEDAAHALESDAEGRPVGAFGAVSVFSLSKHLPGRGGVLSLDGGVSRREVLRLRAELMASKPLTRRAVDLSRSAARSSLDTLHLRRVADRARRAVEPVRPRTWRVPLQAPRLRDAVSGNDLDQFDPWMETGYPDYRMQQQSRHLKRTLAALRDLERDREQRIAGVLRLRTLDAAAPASREGAAQPLLRVPLLVEDRDTVALELRRSRINVYFVYAPPLDDYSGAEFSEPSSHPEAARWWAAHVLPIDPHDAERVLEMLGKNRIRLREAIPPSI
ncbi:MAG TPA: DegT/DnrJ/EryC1/StrS family aminotransferase [Gaiellales bacterium]|nr:DegT/DnrJ/EryC1/StrS family aminotransferase [Gaiellales bacterium]